MPIPPPTAGSSRVQFSFFLVPCLFIIIIRELREGLTFVGEAVGADQGSGGGEKTPALVACVSTSPVHHVSSSLILLNRVYVLTPRPPVV